MLFQGDTKKKCRSLLSGVYSKEAKYSTGVNVTYYVVYICDKDNSEINHYRVNSRMGCLEEISKINVAA